MVSSQQNNPFFRQNKGTDKIAQLKTFVNQSEYIDVKEQPNICNSFGLSYLKGVFQNEYRKRFYEYLKKHTTTVATVSKVTNIPHKYLCECKAFYENKGLLKIITLGRCPTTGSNNVQFVSTKPDEFERITYSNQLKLF